MYIDKLNENFFSFYARRCFLETSFLPDYIKNNLNIQVLKVEIKDDELHPYLTADVKIDDNHQVTFYCTDTECSCVASFVSPQQRKVFNEIYLQELDRQAIVPVTV